MHLRHKWEIIETIGRVVTQRCSVCGKTRVRVIPAIRRAGYRGRG
ncbi:hypothetical protein GCM10022252_26930 [Streptosporangium oxazolinicum]|uniref:Uncharacterized protein n=1 Tax=Streptosporangium oxazolinicum TaxID=909287 RepID=A0ABP8ASU8_9ACTN